MKRIITILAVLLVMASLSFAADVNYATKSIPLTMQSFESVALSGSGTISIPANGTASAVYNVGVDYSLNSFLGGQSLQLSAYFNDPTSALSSTRGNFILASQVSVSYGIGMNACSGPSIVASAITTTAGGTCSSFTVANNASIAAAPQGSATVPLTVELNSPTAIAPDSYTGNLNLVAWAL